MPRRPRFERIDPVDLSAVAPHGIVRTADLVAAGFPPSAIQYRCLTGRWQRLGPGVLRIGPGDPETDQTLHAALAYGGSGAVVTGVHALHRHELTRRGATGPVRLLVPAPRRRRSTERFLVERTDRLPEGVVRGGVAVAPVERAVLDTARCLTDRDAVLSVIAEAVQRGRTTPARLHRELREGSQRGSAIPRRVLRDVEIGVRSVAEGWALRLHRRSGLPAMLWNPRIFLPHGPFLAAPDGYLDEVAMAWEVDSREFHFSPEEWEATLRRRADMTNAGIVVVHHSPRAILDRPEQVVRDLHGAYRLAASRPCPDLIVRAAGPPGERTAHSFAS